MSEVSPEHRWWETESPYDGEPDAIDAVPEDSPEHVELLDGRFAYELFKDVKFVEDGASLRFYTPDRTVDGGKFGEWKLRVYGERKWFKERDDYGSIRFTTSGNAMWVPHLYPFEEIDENGLPLILDRERCEVTVVLHKEDEGEEPYPTSAEVHTRHGTFYAQEDIAYFNPDNDRYFAEFTDVDRVVLPEKVTYPDIQWHFLADYLDSKGRYDDYWGIMTQELPFPEEYHNQFVPLDWKDRTKLESTWHKFGTIWVPVDVLRGGDAEAVIEFPTLQGQ